jgi:DNA-binding HxlR family transcriptional regulator
VVEAPALTSGMDSILRTADAVGDAWSWLVLREAVLHDVTRFAEFHARLGMPRSTLSARLTQLTAAGLLAQHRRPQGPEYHLTDSGQDFLGCLLVAMRWGDQWYFRPDTRPQKGTHSDCGSPLEAVLRCAVCRQVLRARDVLTSARPAVPDASTSDVKRQKRRRPSLELLERQGPSSVARTLAVTGEWWSALIIRECFFGIRRFDEFQRRLDIAPNILSQRLRRLVQLGVVAKVADDSWAVRHEYRLTEKGMDLYHVPLAILTWGRRWLGAAESDTRLTHTPCGSDVRAVLSCGSCAQPIWRSNVVLTGQEHRFHGWVDGDLPARCERGDEGRGATAD